MPILLCPGCWLYLIGFGLLWLLLLFFAKVCKFNWAIKTSKWCTDKLKTLHFKKKKEKDDGPCQCPDCGCRFIKK
jgi:hypothetical protein